MTKEDFNSIPVFYCKKCLSLKIRDVEHLTNSEYCDECGSTDIATGNINEWEKKYNLRFGHNFLDKY